MHNAHTIRNLSILTGGTRWICRIRSKSLIIVSQQVSEREQNLLRIKCIDFVLEITKDFHRSRTDFDVTD